MFDLKEYTIGEYKADMQKLLSEKGLRDAVKVYIDKIDEEVEISGVGYVMHRTVQEYLCDILYLIELSEKE